ncbi:MAG: hypothetical protein VKL59_00495 [Nostocaceae cyanobacterium]|nr:hypothetical protein [Nostocaceae cyanobacterium]
MIAQIQHQRPSHEAPPDALTVAQQELEEYLETLSDAIAPIRITYNFDYNQFDTLQNLARTTLGNFLLFVRRSFDTLIESGKALNTLYNDCITQCPNGKKIFSAWLKSADFGASRYIASSAIEIYKWFSQLPKRIQRLVKENVQKWSVAALRQLTKVSTDLVKELIRSPKTAAQVREAGGKGAISKGAVLDVQSPQNTPAEEPNFAPGVRVIVTGDDKGCNGYTGIIISKWDKTEAESWWVLLDYTIAQGIDSKHLFKTTQIQPEAPIISTTTKNRSQEMYTAEQVDAKIKQALAKKDIEQAEERLGKLIEIRETALKQAQEEIDATNQYAQDLKQTVAELQQNLLDAHNELQQVRHLVKENEQLSQRIAELERAVVNSNNSNWSNTFTQQAAKVVNTELAAQIEPLSLCLEAKEQEVAALKELAQRQQLELTEMQNSPIPNQKTLDKLISNLGVIFREKMGITNWSRYGYRATNGERYCGLEAIEKFELEVEEVLGDLLF